MTVSHTIFLDVDGTLIDHDQRLASSAVDAVRGARRNGHLVFLSTGRSRSEIPAHVLDIGFDGVISASGGFIEYEGALVATHVLPAKAVDEMESFFRAHGIEYALQALDSVYPSEGVAARISSLYAHLGVERGASSDDTDGVVEWMAYRGRAPREGIAKATFFGEDPSTFVAVRDGLGTHFHVITGTMPYLGEAGGEVSHPGINKGAAIVELVALLERPISRVIAIGDSANDLEMFDVAGLAIAMGNAVPDVRARAHETTTSVHEHGVWNAFRHHGLS